MKSERAKASFRDILRVFFFAGIGILLFFAIQRLILAKLNAPLVNDNLSFMFEDFYSQDKGSQEVLFLGTSHAEYSVTPMELYKNHGIVSYNLGSPYQPIEGTYYLLREGLKKQHPKVVLIDASSLFFEEQFHDSSWRYLIDTMPFGSNKWELGKELEKHRVKEQTSSNIIKYLGEKLPLLQFLFPTKVMRSVLIPLIEYHTRWKELTIQDVRDYLKCRDYYSKGYNLNTYITDSGVTIEKMNDQAQLLSGEDQIIVEEYVEGEEVITITDQKMYDPVITESLEQWVDKIRNVCEEEQISLLFVKFPSILTPLDYSSAWTKIRSDYMKKFAHEHELEYLDLVYDVDLGIDTHTDFSDGGYHLNYLGARKVTDFLGNYLKDRYGLGGREYDRYSKDIPIYDSVCAVAELELKQNFEEYMDMLRENASSYIICMAVNGDMCSGLSRKEAKKLSQLGLRFEYGKTPALNDAFAAIIDAGEIVYEGTSNRTIEHAFSSGYGSGIHVVSKGWLGGSKASITVNQKEYASGSRGLNVVVIDKETGLVVDSVTFDMSSKDTHLGWHHDPQGKITQYWLKRSNK